MVSQTVHSPSRHVSRRALAWAAPTLIVAAAAPASAASGQAPPATVTAAAATGDVDYLRYTLRLDAPVAGQWLDPTQPAFFTFTFSWKDPSKTDPIGYDYSQQDSAFNYTQYTNTPEPAQWTIPTYPDPPYDGNPAEETSTQPISYWYIGLHNRTGADWTPDEVNVGVTFTYTDPNGVTHTVGQDNITIEN